MFYIRGSVEFYGKMIQDYDDFAKDTSSARHAINCATSAYHIAEWIWGDWLKDDYRTWAILKIRDLESFLAWLDNNAPWFSVIQALTNGSKHFGNRKLTKFTNSYADEEYVEDDYQVRLLEILVNDEGKERWIEAIIVIEAIVMFWHEFFRTYRPKAHLRKPVYPFNSMSD